jgi:hypothetical protein
MNEIELEKIVAQSTSAEKIRLTQARQDLRYQLQYTLRSRIEKLEEARKTIADLQNDHDAVSQSRSASI